MRARRLDLSLPVRFASEDGEVKGHCLNISESGLLATFDRSLEVWVKGRVSIIVDRDSQSVDARVVRVNEREAGLAFRFVSDAERHKMSELVAYLAQHTALAGNRPPF